MIHLNRLKTKKINLQERDNILYEMSNLNSKNTGMEKGYIWVSSKRGPHSARVKFSYTTLKSESDPSLIVSISTSPEVILNKIKATKKEQDQVIEFVKLNYDLLINLWNTGTYLPYDSTEEWIHALKKI